jgi:aspartate-semialdehyde dehydrogenase
MNNPPRLAIAGVTGAVGQEFLRILEQRKFPYASIKMLASARSAGSQVVFKGEAHMVEELTAESFDGLDLALFSAGGSISKQYAPLAAEKGCVVVDNSSAFRMDPNTPLVVPEVNPRDIEKHQGIIANPNCSTIIMNVPVWPLHQAFGVKRVVASTYQAASGAGAKAMAELEQQARDWVAGQPLTQDIFGKQYLWNLFSHNSDIDPETGYNTEETKMIKETRKIFHDEDIRVSVTCVRVPVLRAHSESINLTFSQPVTEQQVRDVLAEAPGVSIMDDRATNRHPEPLDASDKDDVYVGRIRPDLGQDEGYGIEMFIAGDQIRKGAALNAVQIAELLLDRVPA